MLAPVIPAINDHEIPEIIKRSAENGAVSAAYTVIRLNGAVGEIFKDWLHKNFPDRASRVWKLIESLHGGNVNDTQWGRRMKGEGNISDMINQLFRSARLKYMADGQLPELDTTKFRRSGNYQLF